LAAVGGGDDLELLTFSDDVDDDEISALIGPRQPVALAVVAPPP